MKKMQADAGTRDGKRRPRLFSVTKVLAGFNVRGRWLYTASLPVQHVDAIPDTAAITKLSRNDAQTEQNIALGFYTERLRLCNPAVPWRE